MVVPTHSEPLSFHQTGGVGAVAVALFLEEGVGVEEELLALVLGLRLKI